jgi:hypothetical protein
LEKRADTGVVQSSTSSKFDNIRLFLDHRGVCRSPSVIATLLPSKNEKVDYLNDSKKETISTQISTKGSPQFFPKSGGKQLPTGGSAGCNSESVPLLSFTGMSTASSIGDFFTTTTDCPGGGHDNSEPPSWFSDLKTSRSEVEKIMARDESFNSPSDGNDLHDSHGEGRKTAVMKSLRRERKEASSKEGRSSARHNATDDGHGNLDSETKNVVVSCNNAEKISVPRTRRPSGGDGGVGGGGIGGSAVLFQPAAVPRRGGRGGRRRGLNKEDERKEEASLRQSLEALSKSDLRNRGRIECELRSSAIIEVDKLRATNCDSRSTYPSAGLQSLNLSHFDVADGVLSDEIEKQNILKQRSHRIDEVQETVSSALQDLASVMSNLTMSGKHSLFSPASAQQQPSPQHFSDDSAPTGAASGHNDAARGQHGGDEGPLALALEYEHEHEHEHEHGVESPTASQEAPKRQQQRCTSVVSTPIDEDFLESSVYEIPVLPRGKVFQFDVISTW